jgi:hypothetical protein
MLPGFLRLGGPKGQRVSNKPFLEIPCVTALTLVINMKALGQIIKLSDLFFIGSPLCPMDKAVMVKILTIGHFEPLHGVGGGGNGPTFLQYCHRPTV